MSTFFVPEREKLKIYIKSNVHIKVGVANLLCVRFCIVIYNDLYAHQVSVKLFMQLLACPWAGTKFSPALRDGQTFYYPGAIVDHGVLC
jgi:hypothetical protein